MKTLKILRPLLLAAGLVCLLVALAPRVMVQGKPEWMMIALLAVCVIAIPVSYVQRIRKQQSEMYLSRTEKGMVIMYIVLWSVFTLYSAYLVISSCMKLTSLALLFIGLSAMIDYSILYKAKQEFEKEHTQE